MKVHLQPADFMGRRYKALFYAELHDQRTMVFKFWSLSDRDCGEQRVLDIGDEIPSDFWLELPPDAIEAFVTAAQQENIGVGKLDTLVVEELRQQRARVDKLIDHLLK